MRVRLLRLLDHPRLPWAAALLAVALCLPALRFGLLADDWLHRALILAWKGQVHLPLLAGAPPRAPLTGLFVFFDGSTEGLHDLGRFGLLPWWAAEGLKASFLRPLAVASHLLDYALWPGSPVAMHLHSLAWLALAVLGAAALYQRLAGAPRVAALATLLFAVQDHHAGPALWIANRNALMAFALTSVTLLLHDRWRREGSLGAGVLASATLGVGLACSEAALGACAFLAAYALCLERGRLARRLASLAIHLIPLGAWAACYMAGGYGTAGAQSYVHPLSLDFPRAVAERIPVLLGALWAKLPCDVWIAMPRGIQVGLVAASLAVVVLVGWLLLPVLRASPRARFWTLGMVLAAVPVCASFPMDRLLLFLGLGAAPLLAEALAHLGWPATPLRGPCRWGFYALIGLHLVLAPLLLPVKVVFFGVTFGVFERAVRMAPADEAVATQRLVWVNGTTLFTGFVPVIRALDGDPAPRGQWLLAHMLTDMELARPDARTLVATAPDGMLRTPPEQLVRDVRVPFTLGEEIERDGLRVTVEALTPDGRPRVVRYESPVDLDDPSLRWVVWRDGRVESFEVPPVGGSVHVDPCWPPFIP
ncbi:MAG: hypothetical protein ABIO70_04755 [Pseudomonadota bacterium]